ncbi:MAG: AraC family transcriptional regulator [Verrucomicrobiota bacterium]
MTFKKRVYSSPDFVSKQVLQSDYHFVDLTPSEGESLVLVGAGRERCDSGFHLKRNRFKYFAVELIVSGKWEFVCGGMAYELGPGSVFAYSPETSFNLRCCSDQSSLKYFVDFAGRHASLLIKRAGLVPGVPKRVTPDGIRALFDQVLDTNGYSLTVAREMGSLIIRLILMRIGQDQIVDDRSGSLSYETYLRCRGFIQAEFRVLRSVEEVSSRCHLDRAYLSRLFKIHSKESPYHFLTRMKMEYAAERLRNQRIAVKAVAAEVAYDDPFHFSRLFKKFFGLSPKHYATGNS